MGIALFDLGLLRIVQHRHAQARTLCAEGLVLYQEFGDRRGIACCLGILAGVEARRRPRSPRGEAPGSHGGSARERGLACQASYNEWIGDRSFAS